MRRFAEELKYLWLACKRNALPAEMRRAVVQAAAKQIFNWETEILRSALQLRYELADNTTPFRMLLHIAYCIPQLVDRATNFPAEDRDLRLRLMVVKPSRFSPSRHMWYWLRKV